MRIAVIGAAGKAGRLIAAEAKSRGFDVTAIVKPGSADRLDPGYSVMEKSLYDLSTEDLKSFDAVVDAFGSFSAGPGAAEMHITSMEHLISIFKELPEVRLLVVGGAGSLYMDEQKSSLVIDTIPEAYRAVPAAMAEAFAKLKESGINWTYFSPAPSFMPDGRRTGKYILSTDYRILNSMGEAAISYADYAIAMVDEIEQHRFPGKRFTAVSDTSFVQNEPGFNLFNITTTPFTRRGAFFGVYVPRTGRMSGGLAYATGKLVIQSRRGGVSKAGKREYMNIYPVYQGIKVPYAIHTTAYELVLSTAYGKITLCYPESRLLYIKGENGLSLKLETSPVIHEVLKPKPNGAWEQVIRWISSAVYTPIKGRIEMNAPWEWERLSTPIVKGEILPDENGEFLLAMEEFLHAGAVRDTYPTYEEGLANAKADWEDFLQYIPNFGGSLDEKRERAAYMLWSYIISASGKIKRPMIYMTPYDIASSWQMSQNAAALRRDMELSAELLLNMIDMQSPQGQFPDFYDDFKVLGQCIKPPIQGWALKWIMKDHDLKAEIPADKLFAIYEGFGRWANWFTRVRDDDHDGMPQYEHGDESGFDDSSLFEKSNIIDSPDLSAYLVLLYEALGDLAGMLNRADEAADWNRRSKELLNKMIAKFWNGEKFVAFVHKTGEVTDTESIMHYIPLILGKRLPEEIIDKMAADLNVEGEFLTPYGLASEKLTSENFRASGMARGFVLPPVNLILITGLYDCGKVEQAKMTARRYCEALKNSDFNFLINPMAFGAGGFGCSWSACAYMILADLAANM